MVPKRGQLFRLKSDAAGKQRIVVIVSRTELNAGLSVVAVPFYSSQFETRKYEDFCAEFAKGEGGLTKDCVAKTDQITYVLKSDLELTKGSIGFFNESQMLRLLDALKWTLKIEP